MSTGNIGKIKASRVNNVPNVESYLGEKGILFFNFANGVIRLSDGVTPGGVPIPYNIASNTTIGGIKAGPGANVSSDGTLTIDTTGLPLSIGNLSITDTSISTLVPNSNLNLITNGNANIALVGNVQFFTTQGYSNSNPYFEADDNGILTIKVTASGTQGAFALIGSTTGNVIDPGLPGAMLHITGQHTVPSRIYIDGNDEYVSFVARRFNGNIAVPTQVLAGESIYRINATAATNVGLGNVATAQIRFSALENQTTVAQGSEIAFTVTPIGSSVSSRVEVANVTVANGLTATKFTTSGTITATGNITASHLLGNIVMPAVSDTSPPLQFTTSSLLTTPTAGGFEYNGAAFYGTPHGIERGVIPTQQWFILNADRSMTFNTTAAQSVFGVSPMLQANTRYHFRIRTVTTRTTGDNNSTLEWAWDGNVGLSRINYTAQTKIGTISTVAAESMAEFNINSGFTTPVTISGQSNPPSTTTIILTGTLETNANPGTLTPLITWSGATAAGAVTISAGSNFYIYPLGSATGNLTIGDWR